MELHVELTRFRVKPGMSGMVDEWMAFLNDNMEETLLTLEGEKMYVETIFRELLDGVEYLYWYSIQASGGIDVAESDSEIDKQHLIYWEACIDKSFGCQELMPQVSMIPHEVRHKFIEMDLAYQERLNNK